MEIVGNGEKLFGNEGEMVQVTVVVVVAVVEELKQTPNTRPVDTNLLPFVFLEHTSCVGGERPQRSTLWRV